MSDTQQGPGWWQASDGKWYPPETHPNYMPPPLPPPMAAPSMAANRPESPQKPSPAERTGRWWKWPLGIVIGLIALAVVVVALGGSSDDAANPSAPADSTTVPTDQGPTSSAPAAGADTVPPIQPVTEFSEPEPPDQPQPDALPGLTASQQNATRSAMSYLDLAGFSRQGLIDQLSSEYGDRYPIEDATVAVDALDVEWNEQAVRSAESYLELTGFSRQGLIDQLSSEYGDEYTIEQATYAVDAIGPDWNAEAVESAESYLELTAFSCQGLVEQLSSDYGDQYTTEQATHAADYVGLC